MNRQQLLRQWKFPHLNHGGIALVARTDADKCLRMILEQNCRLHGYDGFTLHSDGQLQPHMEWSASWSWKHLPFFAEMLKDVLESPASVTHFEFVFSNDI